MNFKSQLEEKVYEALSQSSLFISMYRVKKETQWKEIFSEVSRGREAVDFYYPQIPLVLEVQGRQHYEPVDFVQDGNAVERYKQQTKRDARLQSLCKSNNILYLEVSHEVVRSSTGKELGIILDNAIVELINKES